MQLHSISVPRRLGWSRLGIALLLIGVLAAVWGGDGNNFSSVVEAEEVPEASYPFPKPLPKHLELDGNISGDRLLSLQELDLILRLSQFLLDDRNEPETRATAARSLGSLGHKYAIPALLAVIRSEKSPSDIRGKAILALSRIRDKRAVEHLIDMLDDDLMVHYQLIKITGVGIGFGEEHDTAAERRQLQAEWKMWWNKNRERAYLRSRTHVMKSLPISFWSEEMWSPSLVRSHPPLKMPLKAGEER